MQEKTKRGFLEDWRIGVELAITSVFDAVRWVVRKVLFMPEKQALPPWGLDGRHTEWVDQHEVTISLSPFFFCLTVCTVQGTI